MSPHAELGFGIIGTGFVADYHAQAIKATPGARLVGVADLAEASLRRFAEKNAVGFTTTHVEELVARPDIQVICITTPSGAHLEPALAAIRAGKHIVVEKPVEVTLRRVDELLRAADQAHVRVTAIFQNRFYPGAKAVKAAIDRGRFGRFVLASAYVKWHRDREYYRDNRHGKLSIDGGGALMNQAIHAIDLLQWFVGMPAEVSGWTTRCVHQALEVEDTAAAVLRFPGGALGTLEASTALFPGWARRLEVCGGHGSVVREDDRIVRWDFREKLEGDDTMVAPDAGDASRTGAGTPTISNQGHIMQIQDMAAAIRGGRPPTIDGREGRKAVAIIEAVYRSTAANAPVKIDA